MSDDPLGRFVSRMEDIEKLFTRGHGAVRRVQNALSPQQRAANEAEYMRSHWGQRGSARTMPGSVPNHAQGLIDLGELVEIGYLTKKGRDREPVLYHHEFEAPFPLLTYASDGSGLVIVRRSSGYEVREEGIVG